MNRSAIGRPLTGSGTTGMPAPSSATAIDPSACSVTRSSFAVPRAASSSAQHSTCWTSSPSTVGAANGSPRYIVGRRRIASCAVSSSMPSAVYSSIIAE